MFFCGITTCSGVHSADVTSTNLTNIKKVKIQNIIVDGLYITRNTNSKTDEFIPKVTEWDFDTILNAPFEGNLLGGNVNFTADQIQCLRLKRAEIDSYKWITLFEIPINSNEDLDFTRVDMTARGNCEYKYALVPVWNQNIEGNYNINTIKSEFDGIWFVEKEMSINGILNLDLSTTQNIVTSVITPLGRRYPYVNQYGLTNYTSGNINVTFINLNTDECRFEFENAIRYREIVEEFLTNGMPKIIKYFDGRIWLAQITDSIAKDESSHYENPIQSISFTEIGKYDSSTDLYNSNIIDVNIEGGITNNAVLSYTI